MISGVSRTFVENFDELPFGTQIDFAHGGQSNTLFNYTAPFVVDVNNGLRVEAAPSRGVSSVASDMGFSSTSAGNYQRLGHYIEYRMFDGGTYQPGVGDGFVPWPAGARISEQSAFYYINSSSSTVMGTQDIPLGYTPGVPFGLYMARSSSSNPWHLWVMTWDESFSLQTRTDTGFEVPRQTWFKLRVAMDPGETSARIYFDSALAATIPIHPDLQDWIVAGWHSFHGVTNNFSTLGTGELRVFLDEVTWTISIPAIISGQLKTLKRSFVSP